MAYKITEDCIACAACEPECEEGAIAESGDIYVIAPALCSDCGTCAEVCPVDACVPAPGAPAGCSQEVKRSPSEGI